MRSKALLVERVITIALMVLFAAAGIYAIRAHRTEWVIKAFGNMLLLPLPRLIVTRLRLKLGIALPLLWCAFISSAVLLGTFLDFYYTFSHWDKLLHLMSGAMSAVAAFWAYELAMDRLIMPEKKRSALLLIMILAFLTGCAVAMLWETYEFTMDRIFDTNYQRYKEDPLSYSGLIDTMTDMICGGSAGLLASYVMYRFKLRRPAQSLKQ